MFLQWLKGHRWLQLVLGFVAVLFVVAVVPPFRRAAANVASKVILFVASPFAPSIKGFEDLPRASRVLAADGTEIGALGTEGGQPVKLAQLPPHVTRAVLAAEDADFYGHSGVDPTAVLRALFNNLQGNAVQGGSTITQQLAKLNYGGSQRTAFRKLKEVLYASKLESTYSKDRLLERYLNQVYFGNGAYGIAVASETFFGVPPERLTPAQAATLAGKIRAPSTLDPYRRPDAVVTRRNQVLAGMHHHGWLDQAELDRARAAPLDVVPARPAAGAGTRAPQFVAYVGREAGGLDQLGGTGEARGKQVFTGGYTIQTTLDPKAQDQAGASVKAILGQPGDPTTAIASVQPGDGAIRALFGGLDPSLQFDVASQGRRQPGSSFKPYVYLAMLRAGIDPRSQFDSGSPKTLQCQGTSWTVNNFEGEGGGLSTVDNALTHSINAVFAQVMVKVGPGAVQQTAERAGIAPDEVTPAQCAMALGGLRQGVTPLEQAAGFATFAAKGVYAAPYAIARVTDRNGRVVYQHQVKSKEVFDPKEAGVLNAALEGVVNQGTGTAAAIGRPLAGKTGTTENYGNAWFIGYVPQMATAVWVGRPQGDVPMTNVHGIQVTGGSFPARIFSRYMRAALAGVPVRDLFTASPDELSLHPAGGGAPLANRPPPATGPATPTSEPPTSTTEATTPPPIQFAPTVPTVPVTRPRPPPTSIVVPTFPTSTTSVPRTAPRVTR